MASTLKTVGIWPSAWTHVCELLQSNQQCPGPFGLTLNMLEVLIKSMRGIIEQIPLPLWPVMSLRLPYQIIHKQSRAPKISVWMCLYVVCLY